MDLQLPKEISDELEKFYIFQDKDIFELGTWNFLFDYAKEQNDIELLKLCFQLSHNHYDLREQVIDVLFELALEDEEILLWLSDDENIEFDTDEAKYMTKICLQKGIELSCLTLLSIARLYRDKNCDTEKIIEVYKKIESDDSINAIINIIFMEYNYWSINKINEIDDRTILYILNWLLKNKNEKILHEICHKMFIYFTLDHRKKYLYNYLLQNHKKYFEKHNHRLFATEWQKNMRLLSKVVFSLFQRKTT